MVDSTFELYLGSPEPIRQTSNGSKRPISSKDLDLLPLADGTSLTKGARH